jgi:DNA-binding transcriptional regulator YiaG
MNLDRLLKAEMVLQARRASKAELKDVRTKLNNHRKEILVLKRELVNLTRSIKRLVKTVPKSSAAVEAVSDGKKLRFRPAGFAKLRQKLQLTQGEMARLLGVSALTVLKWEKGTSRPRAIQLAAISAVRKMGKRAVTAKLGVESGE